MQESVFEYLGKQQDYDEAMATSDDDNLESPTCPEPLLLWLQCNTYGSLPFAGGVLEQPYLMWSFMQEAGNSHAKWHAIRRRLQELASVQKPTGPTTNLG